MGRKQVTAQPPKTSDINGGIKMDKVESSNIYSIGYDSRSKTLQVQFKDRTGKKGAIYQYRYITPLAYHQLMEASSKGTHFTQNIKNNIHITCEKVSDGNN